MHASSETTTTAVLDGLASPVIQTAEQCHPTERSLGRFVANELGPQRKKTVVRHLESCAECRKTVARLHEVARRFRDLERRAIAFAVERR